MSANVYSFRLVKAGNTADECEDSCDFVPDADPSALDFAANPSPCRFAIADGATESSFSAEWAELLTKRFVEPDSLFIRNPGESDGRERWLRRVRDEWHEKVDWQGLSWIALQKAQRGAHATFLGLHLVDRATWRAWAVGDCMLFQVRDSEVTTMWPIQNASEFSNRPELLCSVASEDDSMLDRAFLSTTGKYEGGRDLFVLTTDALGQWFISDCRGGGRLWRDLVYQTRDQAQFDEFVAGLRQAGSIRNDDTAVLIIKTRKSSL